MRSHLTIHRLFIVAAWLAMSMLADAADSPKATLSLAGDPSFMAHRGETILNNHPKTFSFHFSTPMDRASTEQALRANLFRMVYGVERKAEVRATSPTLGLRLEWRDDQSLKLHLARPSGMLTLSLNGAQTLDGRSFFDGGPGLMTFSAQPPQVIHRLDRSGRVIAEFLIPQTILTDLTLFGDRYALGFQNFGHEDGSGDYPCLLEFKSDKLIKTAVPGWSEGIWSMFTHVQWDPQGPGFLIAGSSSAKLHSIQSIQAGQDGKTIFALKEQAGVERMLIGVSLSPDGNRIAAVRATNKNTTRYDPNARWPLELFVLDREGKVVSRHDLPVTGRQFEYGCLRTAVAWPDAHTVSVAGSTAQGSARCLVNLENKTIETRQLKDQPTTHRSDVFKKSGTLGSDEDSTWVVVQGE